MTIDTLLLQSFDFHNPLYLLPLKRINHLLYGNRNVPVNSVSVDYIEFVYAYYLNGYWLRYMQW